MLSDVTERGPLAASQLSEPRRQTGQWWDRRSVGRRALEVLFADGRAGGVAQRELRTGLRPDRTSNSLRRTRAVGAAGLDDAQRELIFLAARCLGVATVADLADYFWLRPLAAKASCSRAGRVRTADEPVTVEGWPQPAYLPSGSVNPRASAP